MNCIIKSMKNNNMIVYHKYFSRNSVVKFVLKFVVKKHLG